MTKNMFEIITNWQQQTFGKATALSKMAHLVEEIDELHAELLASETISNEKEIAMEFADCFILLFGAASSHGMSYEDICTAINEKMAINMNRKWGEPESNGVVKHIK